MKLKSFLTIFDPAPYLPEMKDEKVVGTDYKYWRYRIFYSMLLGYALYYFTRRSFIIAQPGIIASLGFDNSQLGILRSVFYITYGVSKFLSGIMADRSNPRYFMAFGLLMTGICNIFFGLSTSLWLFIVFWGANGFFQGFGWPACARSLMNWYSQSERGAWWSSVSIAHNLGAFISPWILGYILQHFGWSYAMYLPGAVCIAGSLFLINRLRDSPQSLGLPAIEKFRNDYPTKESENEPKESTRELLKDVLSNKYIWILAVAYFFLYVLRMGISDLTALFLHQTREYGVFTSSGVSSFFEMGGLCGTLFAGWSSDRFFKAKRGPVCILFAFGILCSISLFWLTPPEYFILEWIAIFLMGFTIFGPQMLIGLCASELCNKKAAATANGFVGWIAYFGAAASGYPLGFVIDKAGWDGAFIVLFGCSLMCLLLLLPLRNVTRATVKQI